MDDRVILVQTRWQHRRALRRVRRTVEALKVKQHPDKTFIGRTCRGDDFLGYQFMPIPSTTWDALLIPVYLILLPDLYVEERIVAGKLVAIEINRNRWVRG